MWKSSYQGPVGIVVHTDMGTVKVHNTHPCEFFFVSKEDVSYRLSLKQILGGEIDKTLIFHDGKEE
jgi:hypothetical protein